MEKKLQKPIQSVERAIKILDCFSLITPSLSLASISEMTGLNINTARGLVNTLVENQLLLRDADTGNYKLGFYFVSKASMIHEDINRYIRLFKPLLDEIATKYHFSTSLQMVYHNQIFSIYCAYPTKAAYYIVMSEYTDLPLSATSSGKLLLANQISHGRKNILDNFDYHAYTINTIKTKDQLLWQLEDIARKGYATEIEEFVYDVGSLAIPLYDELGRLSFTVSSTFFVKYLLNVKDDLLKDFQRAVEIWNTTLHKEV